MYKTVQKLTEALSDFSKNLQSTTTKSLKINKNLEVTTHYDESSCCSHIKVLFYKTFIVEVKKSDYQGLILLDVTLNNGGYTTRTTSKYLTDALYALLNCYNLCTRIQHYRMRLHTPYFGDVAFTEVQMSFVLPTNFYEEKSADEYVRQILVDGNLLKEVPVEAAYLKALGAPK